MTFFPVVERELRLASRRPRTYFVRLGAAGGALALSVLFGPYWLIGNTGGHGLFTTLSVFGVIFCLIDGLRGTVDCISAEKREGTLGLLFLTDLKGFDVIFGKLASTAVRSFYGLLATFPVLGISLLLGGVTAGEFWRMVAALVTILLLSQSVAICTSAVVWSERAAHSWTISTLVMLVFLPLLPDWIARLGRSGPVWPVDVFSPFTLYQSAFTTGGVLHRFAWALLANLLMTGIFLSLAGILVRRHWQQKPVTEAATSRAARRRRVDQPRRRRLLDLNPMTWLALRFHRPGLEWAPPMLYGVIVLTSLGLGREGFMSVAVLSAWVMNLMIKMRLAGEGARMGAELRQDGQLELLMTTPMGSGRMTDGLGQAVRALIYPGTIGLLGLEFVALLTGTLMNKSVDRNLTSPLYLLFGLLYFPLTLLDFHAFATTALWQGFSSGKTNVGNNRTQFRLLLVPLILTSCCFFMAPPFGYFVSYLFSPILLVQSQSSLKSEFAAIATGLRKRTDYLETSGSWLGDDRV